MTKPIKIKRWIQDGHSCLSADGLEDTDDLLAAAGRALDKACSHDIMGEVMFEGDDGKFYVGCVEFDISEADPAYVKQVLADIEGRKKMNERFNLGDEVRWTSQASGHTKTKVGTVVAIVPPGVNPRTCVPAGPCKIKNCGFSRGHESYLVRIGKRINLNWPVVSNLQRAHLGIGTFSEYQDRAYACAIDKSKSVTYMALGLANEAGEVCGKLKKALRDDECGSLQSIGEDRKEQIVGELGDVLWYLSGLATQLGVPLEAVATLNIDKLECRKERGVIKGDGDKR